MYRKPLGQNQREVLMLSRTMGAYPLGGWQWNTYSQTMNIIKPLIAKGLLAEHRSKSPYAGHPDVYTYVLTDEGRETADELIRRRKAVQKQMKEKSNV